jgi:tetratricopeptide (TPR) repeat protein
MGTGRRKKFKRHSKGNKGNKNTKSPLTGKEITPKVSIQRDKSDDKLSRPDWDGQAHKTIAGPRLWLFRIITVIVIPALLFLLLEVSLRVIGFGFPTTIAVKDKINGEPCYYNNPKFAWRFFHPNIARTAEPYVFPVKKPEDTYRIFVMGASAAAGTPDGAFCFGRMLQVMLRRQYPQANFEVITAAMPAINSHVVREIAKDCTRYQGDLFIVYLGNNEVVGPYGAGTVFSTMSSSLSVIRLGITLKATKLGQLITNLLESASTGNSPKIWRGMGMFLDKQVRATDASLEIVYKHFRRNLQDIRRLACQSGIKIIFCTVPCNLKDSPPFASLHKPDLTDAEIKIWDEIYQRGVQCEADGNYAEAVKLYFQAAEIDDRYADLQFRLGRCYWEMSEYEKARDKYILARELDTLRFRADSQINEIVRDTAGNKTADGVYLVDAVMLFDKNSPHKTPGEELFYEHVHMNFKGNYLLAGAILRQTEKILPERIKSYRTEDSTFPTEAECAQDLAYTDWDRFSIAEKVLNDYIKQAPFTNQLYHNQRVSRMEQEIDALKAAISPEVVNEVEAEYRRAIEQTQSDWWLHWKYGQLLEDLGKSSAAAAQYHLVLDSIANHYEALAVLGLLYGKEGDLDAAINYNLQSVLIYPPFPESHFNLGFAYHLKKNYDQAVEHYSWVVRLVPDRAEAHLNLGLVLFQQGKVAEAIKAYRNGLKFVPDNLDLHYNLGIVLEEKGQIDDALKELNAALQIDPDSAKVRKVINAIKRAGK